MCRFPATNDKVGLEEEEDDWFSPGNKALVKSAKAGRVKEHQQSESASSEPDTQAPPLADAENNRCHIM